ncbi:hypothetical protein KZ770_11555 [Escherichia coli]|nr:hypothetical protein [Escherichia coli]
MTHIGGRQTFHLEYSPFHPEVLKNVKVESIIRINTGATVSLDIYVTPSGGAAIVRSLTMPKATTANATAFVGDLSAGDKIFCTGKN